MNRGFFLENWKGKVASLLISIAIWYLIKSHLDADKPSFPIPGTNNPVPARTTGPNLDDTLLSPLAPPVPGGDDLN
jgi:hypothetical protein